MAGGARGRPPIVGDGGDGTMSDPLPQAMVLTAIVITLGMTAFVLALAYRSWQLHRHDEVQDDVEDRRIARLAGARPRAVTDDDTEAARRRWTRRLPRRATRPPRRGDADARGRREPLSWLVPLPVVIPLFAAGLALALYRRPRIQRDRQRDRAQPSCWPRRSRCSCSPTTGPIVVDVGDWAAPVGSTSSPTGCPRSCSRSPSAVTLCVLLYSLAQGGEDDEESAPVSIYHPTYLVLAAGVANAFLSGDLFNLYVGFEILLAASYVLITLGGSGERIRAGTIYVVVALL